MTIIGIVIVSRPPILFGHITDGSKIGANGNSSSEKDVENESSGHTRFLGCSLAIAAAGNSVRSLNWAQITMVSLFLTFLILNFITPLSFHSDFNSLHTCYN